MFTKTMATTATTPLKINSVDCFVCYQSNSRCYKINGRKSKADGLKDKLRILLNDDSVLSVLSEKESTSVCRNCYQKIENVTDFIIQLKTSAEKHALGESAKVKRCAASPSVNSNTLVPKSRKKLKLQSPRAKQTLNLNVSATNTELPYVSAAGDASSHTIEDSSRTLCSDHGYSQPQIQLKKDNKPIITLLQSLFNEHQVKGDKQNNMLQCLRSQSSTLTSRTLNFGSVLYKYRDVHNLEENAGHLLDDLVNEMIKRVPLLLKVMLCVAVPASGQVKASMIPVLASAYSILMKHKYDNLSAYHRMTSAIAIRGGLDERAQTRFNHLGLTLSWSCRVALQDNIQTVSEKLIADSLNNNPLVKVTGDNLDIYVKTSQLSRERRHKDLHLFASNLIFSRVATVDMSNDAPKIDITQLNAEKLFMTEFEKAKFLESYGVLLARILCKVPGFQQYRKLVPNHISHEFSQKMSTKSVVYPLPIMFKNETKHEDCMAIMDNYEEQLISLYSQAFGNADILHKYGVPVGGDQLTRVRLQEAKTLRSLSVTPEKRYDHLHPIVCEMWHSKQDLLEKCYKKFFKSELSPGTLNHIKTILHRTDVNGKVKGRFQPHFELLMLVGESMVVEQFLEFFQMESVDSQPQHHLAIDLSHKPEDEQKTLLMKMIQEFMVHYGYGMVDCPERIVNKTKNTRTFLYLMKADGQKTLIKQYNDAKSEPDELYNYSLQLCHWYLHLSEINDTVKEGDLNRTVLNCQYTLPFFYSHSKLSKYLVENIDYVLKCKYLLSPLQRIRVLEGSYVNKHGGKGQNVESDLTQEHSVCNQKTLIRSLGANKSENSIKRVTGAADTIAEICSKFDESVNIKAKNGHRSKPLNETDQELVSKTLRKLRPFKITAGRKCPGFKNMESVPVSTEHIPAMKARLNQIITRLSRGMGVTVERDEDDASDDDIE